MEAKPYKIPHPFRKLNLKMIDIIVQDIREGSTQKLTAEANGITESIFYVWLQQGKYDIQNGIESLCATLVESLARVKQEEVKGARQAIRESDKGHKGAEWTLEHAYWRSFGSNAAMKEFDYRLKELEQGEHNAEDK